MTHPPIVDKTWPRKSNHMQVPMWFDSSYQLHPSDSPLHILCADFSFILGLCEYYDAGCSASLGFALEFKKKRALGREYYGCEWMCNMHERLLILFFCSVSWSYFLGHLVLNEMSLSLLRVTYFPLYSYPICILMFYLFTRICVGNALGLNIKWRISDQMAHS